MVRDVTGAVLVCAGILALFAVAQPLDEQLGHTGRLIGYGIVAAVVAFLTLTYT